MALIDEKSVVSIFPEIDLIEDAKLRQQTIDYWITAYDRSAWSGVLELAEVPYNQKISTRTLVAHSSSVARIAIFGAQNALSAHAIVYNQDYVIAAALLHDACKLLEMDPDATDPRKGVDSKLGRMLAHAVVGG